MTRCLLLCRGNKGKEKKSKERKKSGNTRRKENCQIGSR